MDYKTFKREIENKFLDYLPNDMKDMKVKVHKVNKVNVTLDGISIVDEHGRTGISPTIYINDIYKHYKECGDFEESMKAAVLDIVQAMAAKESINFDIENIESNIIFQLINTIQNQRMLDNVPNRAFQDLSIIYRWVVQMDNNEIKSVLINNEMTKLLGLTELQLFKLAMENTRRILPPCVKSINDVIYETLIKDGMPQELADRALSEMLAEPIMWVISNDRRINGAASMVYEDELYKLAESLKSDLYILPSSVHEVIAISVDMGEPEELVQMVTDINVKHVDIQERLSNQVYHYDKELRRLTFAIGTLPYKKLQWETE